MEIIIGVIILAIIAYLIYAYNGLVKARQTTWEAWSGIDVQLKRRANLIPNLVETVKGYAKHEKGTLKEVIEMRSNAQSVDSADVAGRAKAEGLLGAALGKIIALAEAYPDLKANENFRDLQNSLDEIENEIQMSRRYYNGAAKNLNVMVESFPSNFVAKWFSFFQADYYEVENEADRAVPDVSFNN